MIILKIFGSLFAVLLMFVGLMFIIGAAGKVGFMIAGVFLIIFGIVFLIIIFKGSKVVTKETSGDTVQVVQNIDLPENADLKEFNCRNCGANLKPENLKVTEAGSIMVTCPYCETSYEIHEEPKW